MWHWVQGLSGREQTLPVGSEPNFRPSELSSFLSQKIRREAIEGMHSLQQASGGPSNLNWHDSFQYWNSRESQCDSTYQGFHIHHPTPRGYLPLPVFLFYLLFPLSGMLFPPFCPILPFSSGLCSQLTHRLFREDFLPPLNYIILLYFLHGPPII